MLHALQPAQLRRLDKHQLKTLAENCERSLLAGISTNQDMLTLIEVEKELLRREKIDTRQQLLEMRKTMIEIPASPSVTSSAVLAPAESPLEEKTAEPIEEQGTLELLPVAPNRY
jgi:hypothetical protein